MHDGKSMAMAYMAKHRAQQMAKGGMCAHGKYMCSECHGGQMMANGGEPNPREKGVHQPLSKETHEGIFGKGGSDKERKGMSNAGANARVANSSYESRDKAISAHKKNLEEIRSMGPMKGYAEGGEVEDDDMISRIMKQRYSEGGRVANEDGPSADMQPAEYDDLVKDDDLEFNYTGANSGDELGNDQEDMDREDMISRIMKKRKKPHNPVPA